MEGTHFESFELPSKGLIYDKPIGSLVELRSMTTQEEMIRLSNSKLPYKILATVIESCLREKPAISVYDMCIGDYLFLLNKLRIVTYGTDYKVSCVCPKCGKSVITSGNLDDLEPIEYTEEIEKLKVIKLPVSKKEIELKFQTPRELDLIPQRVKQSEDQFIKDKERGLIEKDRPMPNYNEMYTIISMIKTVDGQVLNAFEMQNFVSNLLSKDSKYLKQKGEKINATIGVTSILNVKCNHCEEEFPVTFRYTGEFFEPTID